MDPSTITAIAAAIAVVITSLTSLIVAIKGSKKVDNVEKIVNGHTTALITEIQTLKHKLGIQDESVPAEKMSDTITAERESKFP